jgi:Fuc2NAc and GlcNAc transferase
MDGSSLADPAGPGLLVLAAILAAATSAVLVAVIRRRAAVLRLVDVPNERSSHVVPTPRGGGLGILAGMTVATGFVRAARPDLASAEALALVALSSAVGAVGLVDDRIGLSARLRLVLHLAAAAALVAALGPISSFPLPPPLSFPLASPWLSAPLTVLWVAAITNFFNFMDGVDGLATGQAILSSVAIAAAGWSPGASAVALALAGGCLGFIPYNWPPARIFMGDVGSGAIGFLLAGLPLLAPPEVRPAAVTAVALGLTFFILDPLLTLARRRAAGKPLMQAHREHLYQLLIPAGTSGSRVTALLLSGAAVLAALGAVSVDRRGLAWPALACAAGLFLVETAAAWKASAATRSVGRGPSGGRP